MSGSRHPLDRLQRLGAVGIPADVEQRIIAGAHERLEGRRAPRVWQLGAMATAAAIFVALVVFWPRGSELEGGDANALVTSRSREPRVERTAPKKSALAQAKSVARRMTTTEGKLTEHRVGRHRVTLYRGAARLAAGAPEQTHLALEEGRARFNVEPLRDDQSFQVATRHLRITVVGTAFTVDVDDECSQVEVGHGRVAISTGAHRLILRRGEIHTVCDLPRTPERFSELEELLRRGLAAARKGQTAAARRAIARYLAAAPDGSFIDEALFQLALIEGRLGNIRKAKALRDQLAARSPRSSYVDRLDRLLREHVQ